MLYDATSWCESVALSVFQEGATANGTAVMYEMCAALIGDDAAMGCFERAAALTTKYGRS
jgi:hypothetical protein